MARLEEKLAGFLESSRVPACVLFVDDGSSDGSGSLIEEMCRRNDASIPDPDCPEAGSAFRRKLPVHWTGMWYKYIRVPLFRMYHY